MNNIEVKELITDFTINSKCSNCGQCCSDLLPMSEFEVSRIKHFITKNNIKEQRHNSMMGVDMTCPFRDEATRKCLIYSVRPAICKQFVCNHTKEDIINAKIAFHKVNRVVFMRNEFYGNKEDVNLFANMGRLLIGG